MSDSNNRIPLQRTGREQVLQALNDMAEGGQIVHLILMKQGETHPEITEKTILLNVKIIEVTEEDMWRMRAFDKENPTVLALIGREPDKKDLNSLMNSPGPIWMMCGVTYASNLGLSIRTAEASGAAGVIITPVP